MDMERLPDNVKEYFVEITLDQSMMATVQDAVQNNLSGILNW